MEAEVLEHEMLGPCVCGCKPPSTGGRQSLKYTRPRTVLRLFADSARQLGTVGLAQQWAGVRRRPSYVRTHRDGNQFCNEEVLEGRGGGAGRVCSPVTFSVEIISTRIRVVRCSVISCWCGGCLEKQHLEVVFLSQLWVDFGRYSLDFLPQQNSRRAILYTFLFPLEALGWTGQVESLFTVQ